MEAAGTGSGGPGVTMTKGGSGRPSAAAPVDGPDAADPAARPARRSHVPAAGTAHAEAVEKAQREMLHEGSSNPAVRTADPAAARGKRPRIGADVVVESLLRQGVDVVFSYPGGVILPLYEIGRASCR